MHDGSDGIRYELGKLDGAETIVGRDVEVQVDDFLASLSRPILEKNSARKLMVKYGRGLASRR